MDRGGKGLRMRGFGDGDRGDGDRYGTTTENSRFLHCAAHDETVSSFGRNDDLFRIWSGVKAGVLFF